jgi:hypothetical protein
MKYLLFIRAEGLPAPEELAILQRECAGWVEEMGGRGVRLFGRELDLPETAATVRVRDGRTLVTDGPFAETKEFVAGFDLIECADRDEAVEVAAKHPSSWFQTIEVRPFGAELRLDDKVAAFGRGEVGDASPYLLIAWMGAPPAGEAGMAEAGAWRRDVAARGLHVLGNALGGPEEATTVRVRGGQRLPGEEPFTVAEAYIGGIDVVNCADRQQAIGLAATHPAARHHAIEVRPFYSE